MIDLHSGFLWFHRLLHAARFPRGVIQFYWIALRLPDTREDHKNMHEIRVTVPEGRSSQVAQVALAAGIKRSERGDFHAMREVIHRRAFFSFLVRSEPVLTLLA
jgi:hypothetical protein